MICPICNKEEYKTLYSKNYTDADVNVEVFSARRNPDKLHGTVLKCKSCGLIQSAEQISSEKLKMLYTDSKFTYSPETKNLKDSYWPYLAQALKGMPKDAYIMEIGCGNGFMLERLADEGYTHAEGIEPSAKAIEAARHDVRPRIWRGMLKEGTFLDDSVDLVFMFQTFDHFNKPNEMLQLCKRMLKPTGKLVLINHDVGFWAARIMGERSPIIDIEHPYLYSKDTIQKILSNNGFSGKAFGVKTKFSIERFGALLPIPKFMKRFFVGYKQTFRMNAGNLGIIATIK